MGASVTETVWRRLSADGLRRTPQREAILDALGDAGDGLPLPVLLARSRRRAPGLGERTAERTVALLVEQRRGRRDRAPGRRGRLPPLRPRPPPPPGLHLVRVGRRARPVRRGRLGSRRRRPARGSWCRATTSPCTGSAPPAGSGGAKEAGRLSVRSILVTVRRRCGGGRREAPVQAQRERPAPRREGSSSTRAAITTRVTRGTRTAQASVSVPPSRRSRRWAARRARTAMIGDLSIPPS